MSKKQVLKAMIYEIERKDDGSVHYTPVTSGMYLTVAMIATTLGICKQSVYREIEAGRLDAMRIGASVRVEVEAFRRWVEECRLAEYERPMRKTDR